MKSNKKKAGGAAGFLGLVLGLGLLGGGIFGINHYQQNKERYDLAKRIADYGPRKGIPRTIEDLQKAIAEYEAIHAQFVKTAAQTGVYWKILGTRFQDKEMYIEALNAFERAVDYAPAEETLHYLSGVNAAYAAKAMHDYQPEGGSGPRAAAYLATAENAYLRALDLAGDYSSARYALANLYAFELNKPDLAVFHLLRYMEGRSGDADAMFVMARAQYMLGHYLEALDWYDQGIALTRDEKKKDQARVNRARIEALL